MKKKTLEQGHIIGHATTTKTMSQVKVEETNSKKSTILQAGGQHKEVGWIQLGRVKTSGKSERTNVLLFSTSK